MAGFKGYIFPSYLKKPVAVLVQSPTLSLQLLTSNWDLSRSVVEVFDDCNMFNSIFSV
jgi:hypothetical protein